MQYCSTIFLYITCHLLGLSIGYSRYYNGPYWNPMPPPPPPPPSPPVVEVVTYSVVAQGGVLHWDHAEKVLYFVDASKRTLYRYDPATTTQKTVKFDTDLSMVIPIRGQRHRSVVALGSELAILRWYWDTGNFSTSHLASVDPQSRWSIGRADVLGRIWAVSVFGNRSSSNLYRVDTAGSCRVDAELLEQDPSNGLAWSRDNKVLYYSSPSGKIEAFDFEVDSGSISNRRTVFEFGRRIPGSPAGLAVDSDGNLWVACLGGSQVIQVDTTNGRLLRQIKVPVSKVTSVVFGGPQLDDLYVASAAAEGGGLEGSVLKIDDLNVRGVPMYSADIKCNPCNDNAANKDWCIALRK